MVCLGPKEAHLECTPLQAAPEDYDRSQRSPLVEAEVARQGGEQALLLRLALVLEHLVLLGLGRGVGSVGR